MTLEPHATAAARGHPPAIEAVPPPGALVNLAETVVIKEENVFVVSQRDGSLPVGEPHPLGIYADDCRFLSAHELSVNGARPRLLVTSATHGSESVHELTNPALPLPGGRVLPLQSMQIRFERCLAGGHEVEETLLVRSYDLEPLALELDLRLGTDFAPMLALRGIVDAGDGDRAAVEHFEHGMRFTARGRDGRHRATTITADRAVGRGDGADALRFSLELPPGGQETIALHYRLYEGEAPPPAPDRPGRLRRARPSTGAWLAERTAVETDDELFNRVLRRALLDIRMLHSRLDSQGYYAAGVPWYATLFGRDSLICATQMLAFDSPMAAQTLRVLAGLLATGTIRRTTPSRGRCCTSCASARSPNSGSPRSCATTGRSTPRRSSSACSASTPTGAATWRCSRSCVARSRRCWAGSTGRATAIATACSSTPSVRRRPAQPGLEGLRRGHPRRARHTAGAADDAD